MVAPKRFRILSIILASVIVVAAGFLVWTRSVNQSSLGSTAVLPAGLPSDPGEAGKATLAGIDSNSNGVRDDIERYIWQTYPDSAKTRQGLMQFSVAEQTALLSGGVKANALLAAGRLRRAIDCLWYIYGGPASFDIWEKLTAQYLNTADRSHADSIYNGLLNGEFFPSTPEGQRKASCEFDPDVLPN